MTTTPKIYVADLAAYNAGILHGAWYDLEDYTGDLDSLGGAVQGMLALGTRKYGRETLSVHEEYAIHDYEGFGCIPIGEYDSLESVLAHADRLQGEPEKYEAWISADRDPEAFDPDRVNGPYESKSDYVDNYLEGVYGSMDLEEVMVNAGMNPAVAEAISQLVHWQETDYILEMWGDPLTEVRSGDYNLPSYYEVEA